MGGKKSSPPKPPVIAIPQPSVEEQELLRKQIDMVNQLSTQSNSIFEQAGMDRDSAFGYLDKLNSEYNLSDNESSLIDKLTQNYYDQSIRDLTTGSNQFQFDTTRKDAIGSLLSRGLTNSTTAEQVLGQLEQARMSMFKDAAMSAAGQNLGLRQQTLTNNKLRDLDIFGTLYTGSKQNAALSNQLTNSALAGASNTGQQLRGNRMDAFNVAVQNAQSQYQYNLQKYQQDAAKRKGLGGTIGGVAGALGGLTIAAMMPGGLALTPALIGLGAGGAIGGGLGSSFL